MQIQVFALCERTTDAFDHFIDEFAADFVYVQDEFEFPWLAKRPEFVTQNPNDILDVLFSQVDEPYAMYWIPPRPSESEISIAMGFFTSDDHIIFGVAVPEEAESQWKSALSVAMEPRALGAAYEVPPPTSAAVFLAIFE